MRNYSIIGTFFVLSMLSSCREQDPCIIYSQTLQGTFQSVDQHGYYQRYEPNGQNIRVWVTFAGEESKKPINIYLNKEDCASKYLTYMLPNATKKQKVLIKSPTVIFLDDKEYRKVY